MFGDAQQTFAGALEMNRREVSKALCQQGKQARLRKEVVLSDSPSVLR